MKFILIGPVPPPIGGISVHMKRVQQRLRDDGIQCNIYNETNGFIRFHQSKDLSFAQISQSFERTESWSRVTFHRAKRKVQDLLKKE